MRCPAPVPPPPRASRVKVKVPGGPSAGQGLGGGAGADVGAGAGHWRGHGWARPPPPSQPETEARPRGLVRVTARGEEGVGTWAPGLYTQYGTGGQDRGAIWAGSGRAGQEAGELKRAGRDQRVDRPVGLRGSG